MPRSPKPREITLYLYPHDDGTAVSDEKYAEAANAVWWLAQLSGLDFAVGAYDVDAKVLEDAYRDEPVWPGSGVRRRGPKKPKHRTKREHE